MQRLKSKTGMHCPLPPALITKKRYKLPSVEDQTDPPPRVDPDKQSKYREQKLPSPIHTTPPSAAERVKYSKNNSEATPPWPLNRKLI